jgi:hypothetical protein
MTGLVGFNDENHELKLSAVADNASFSWFTLLVTLGYVGIAVKICCNPS